MNASILFEEENTRNKDLRDKIFRNITDEVGIALTYEAQKQTCFENVISLISHNLKEIQDNLIKLRKY